MKTLTISREATAFKDPHGGEPVSASALLSELHGTFSEAWCLDTENPFTALGVTGGRLRIVFDPATTTLRVATAYVMPEQLDAEQTKKLVDFTSSQWSDGIGNGSFQGHTKNILSKSLALSILNVQPSANNLGSLFIDVFPMASGPPEIAWSDGNHFDEDLIADLERRSREGYGLAKLALAKGLPKVMA